jgi:hypothetical protein
MINTGNTHGYVTKHRYRRIRLKTRLYHYILVKLAHVGLCGGRGTPLAIQTHHKKRPRMGAVCATRLAAR